MTMDVDGGGDRHLLIFAVFWTADRLALGNGRGRRDRADQFDRQTSRASAAVSDRVERTPRLDRNGLLALAVLPLIGALLVFLGGHETKVEFEGLGQEAK